MINPDTVVVLKQAFAREDSSCMAATEAGCSFDTARRYRRALEAAGVIEAKPVRKVKDGRLVHIERIGAHMATQPRSHAADTRRIQLLRAA